MIEITGNDISELNDTDLRTLIGHLCEAELSLKGIPTSGITFGGDQNAKDGGLDVRVEVSTALHEDSFIPRSNTGFQVKKPDMPRGRINEEMRPKGVLRPVIQELAESGGAYIIVSSQGSTSDSALNDRRAAMRDALADCPNAPNIKLDFYDRGRIAGWVRNHPAISMWVREKMGRPMQGWKSYEKWARFYNGIEEKYELDEHIRLYNSSDKSADALSALAGINELRKILRNPVSSVRLVGLSGVGKTRLLQALFDERIGENPLNRSQVFYADVSSSLNPDPINFAERLMALRKPCILAIDNCSPELHRRLTAVCSVHGSFVSLITIEYDVKDDQPEETKVFRLEPASIELIEKVIAFRFKNINEVSRRAIAKFSGGNARIALALCNTVQGSEDLSNLRDEDLFKRLFYQRNNKDSSLLQVAQVCALVYSFDGETLEGENAELAILGSMVGMDANMVYANVNELKQRDLVQQRGIWKAVLPHALAKKLDEMALKNIHYSVIAKIIEEKGTERIIQSFSRRLGYLHESSGAVSIARRWFSEQGLLKDISNLSNFGMNVFENIAPICPELTLSAIESVANLENARLFFSRENCHYIHFTRVLQALAYEQDLFERSVTLLCHFALAERPNENNNSIRDLLKSLFYATLSGTHATSEQRLNIIRNLVESSTIEHIDLGIYLLGASLESWNFSSHNNFEFGSRVRDYGYSPRNQQEFDQWYKLYIDYTATIATSNLLAAPKTKSLLANALRGLWVKAGMYDELEAAAKKISEHSGWPKAWLAVREIKKYHSDDMRPEAMTRLNCLDSMLKPEGLIEQARIAAFSCYSDIVEMMDDIDEQDNEITYESLRVQGMVRSIGKAVGSDETVFKILITEVLSDSGDLLFYFGQGLADGCDNQRKVWEYFGEVLVSIDDSKRNYQMLCGFLNAVSEQNVCLSEELLEAALRDEVLAVVYPMLQISVNFDASGVERLKRSLEFGLAPIAMYKNMAYGRVHERIDDCALCELLRLISAKAEGTLVALEILNMRLHGVSQLEQSAEIVALGKELVVNYPFTKSGINDQNTYKLGKIVKSCFAGEASKQSASILCTKLIAAFETHAIYPWKCSYVLEALAKTQPLPFLDAFLKEDITQSPIYDVFSDDLRTRPNPMAFIDDNLLITWCDANPTPRYPIMASVITPYKQIVEENILEWTPLTLHLLAISPDPLLVLAEFRSVFRPNSWSGSLSETMQNRLCLMAELKKHSNVSIADWACKEEKLLEIEIRSHRQNELKRESLQNERFE